MKHITLDYQPAEQHAVTAHASGLLLVAGFSPASVHVHSADNLQRLCTFTRQQLGVEEYVLHGLHCDGDVIHVLTGSRYTTIRVLRAFTVSLHYFIIGS